MTLVGCDLHSRKQQVAVLDTTTGELLEQELAHEGDAVERFYQSLRPPVTIGIETTGYTQWFHTLMHRLGHTVLVGEASKIRAMVVRKTKTDRRDARHLLDLLKHDRFPTVWIPDPGTRDLRALIAHRVRLVRMRTMVKNGLQAIALSQRLALRSTLWTRHGLAQLTGLPLPIHTTRRRDDSLELLQWLTTRIDALDDQIAAAAQANPGARLLLTHPGVGPLTALRYRADSGSDRTLSRQPTRRELRRPGPRDQRLGRQTAPGPDHQTGQRTPPVGPGPSGPARDPRRRRSAPPVLRHPASPRSAQGESGDRPQAPRPPLCHAP